VIEPGSRFAYALRLALGWAIAGLDKSAEFASEAGDTNLAKEIRSLRDQTIDIRSEIKE
jgi:GH15 family glucan-1,4-alpha-glucosidase